MPQETPFPPSTRTELDHYFGNNVGFARLHFIGSVQLSPEELVQLQQQFITGMQRAAQSQLPIEDNIGSAQFLHLAEMASGDWNSLATIKSLYKEVYKLIHEELDEKKLFRRVK